MLSSSLNSAFRTACLLAMLAAVLAGGCTRRRYHRLADREVAALVAEKSNDPRWAAPPNFNVAYDRRSRYFDPTDPDYSPMPPDDPASHVFMHRVDGKRGYRRWHRWGDLQELQSPDWWALIGQYTPTTDDGKVKLDLDAAVQLALIHSPEWQQQVEEVYLSALDVSAERFRFDAQFFGRAGTGSGPSSAINMLASGADAVPPVGRSQLTSDTGAQMRRNLATGGTLLVDFANTLVWQFAGAQSYTATSLLGFNLTQPLLRGGGRAVALETLTLAERTLLGNLRAIQRYRQGFYTNLAVGDFSVTGPQRRGGFFGGTGLTGFTGQGSGGFGEVGAATNFGRAGFAQTGGFGAAAGGAAGFAGGGAGNVGGFAGLLQQLQQIRNTEQSLDIQNRTFELLQEYLRADRITKIQVLLFEQNIQTEKANLLQAKVALANAQDTFLRQLIGLPPHLPIELDDSMIRPFQLIDPRTSAVRNAMEDFSRRFGQTAETPDQLTLEAVSRAFDELAELRRRVLGILDDVRRDIARLATDSAADSASALAERKQQLADDLADDQQRIEAQFETVEALRQQLAPATLARTADLLADAARTLNGLIYGLGLVQAEARLHQITVEPIHLRPEEALEIARANRLDWMNNRAAVVDTWRLITFNANALRAGLTLTLGGDLGGIGNNPLALTARNGNLRAGLRFDTPLTRLLERNNYRQILIDYQRDRRTLIRFEDGIHQTLRQDLRQLEQLRENLEVQRRAVSIAIDRVAVSLLNLDEPPRGQSQPVVPGAVPPAAAGSQLGPTAALDLLTAISDLRNSQNNFLSVWLVHYSERMQLMRDLGIMELDDRGMWVDRPLESYLRVSAEEAPLPPPVPAEWLRDAGVEPLGPEPPAERLPAHGRAKSEELPPAASSGRQGP